MSGDIPEGYFWQRGLVRLREIRSEDWESHYYNRFDTEARRLLDYEVELPPTKEEAVSFVEKYGNFGQGTGRLMFTIENQKSENVGGVNINSIDMRNGTFSIGMQIDRDHRDKGYGSAALEILFDYAFFERRLNKFNNRVLEGNVPSARVLEKMGCVKEGIRRSTVYMNGKYMDEILYGLTKDEWIKQKEKNNAVC